MNRVIEFRGFDKLNNKWIFGDLIRIPTDGGDWNTPPSSELTTYITNTHVITHEWVEVDPISVGEFSGLTDKNGKKIFEEDICKVYNFDEPNINPYQVSYDRGSFVFKNDLTLSIEIRGYKTDYIEVIGNVYENPNLCNQYY